MRVEGGQAQGRKQTAIALPQATAPEANSTVLPLRATGPKDERGIQKHHYWAFAMALIIGKENMLSSLIALNSSLVY